MPKYKFDVSYTNEGVNGLLQVGGSHREQAVRELLSSVGGELESFYYAFGGDDAYIIAELPDEVAAGAVSLRISAAGTAAVKTTVLIEPATMDEIVKRGVDYSPARPS